MLPLDAVAFEAPRALDVALALLANPGAQPIAGGTDLVPSMKHRLFAPKLLVQIRRVSELQGISESADGGLSIGAAVTLRDVERSPLVNARYPALAAACRTIATPTIQAMGTLGGNALLDTRCLYYNQPVGWREGLGYCLKASGTVCHVAPKGGGCYAAHSADTVPVLWLLGAELEIAGPAGVRRVPIRGLYAEDGRTWPIQRDEILVRLHIPSPSGSVVHRKMRARGAIDYGILLVAAHQLDGRFRAVVSAVGPQPIEVAGDSPEQLAEAAFKAVQPLTTHAQPVPWRKKMVRVEVGRAATALPRSP